jgi:phosphatidylglycerol---prolipoprotein diacylglyceryl transferase
VDPIAFHVGGFAIYWYGILAATGFGAGLWTASRRASRLSSLPREAVADLGPWLIVGGLVGARLWFVISYWNEDFAGRPLWEIFNVRGGGLVFYGGLVGAVVAAGLFTRLRRLPLWELGDVLAPSIALGHAFGRVGCFMNGCCFGAATSLPWGVTPPGTPVVEGLHLHPTQLYEALLLVGLCVALAWQYRRRRFPGHTFAVYLIAYAVVRFLVEFLRGDYGDVRFAGLRPGQTFSVVILAAGIVLYLAQRPAASATDPPPKPG